MKEGCPEAGMAVARSVGMGCAAASDMELSKATHPLHTTRLSTAMRRQSGGSGAASRWDDSNKELTLLRLEVEVRAHVNDWGNASILPSPHQPTNPPTHQPLDHPRVHSACVSTFPRAGEYPSCWCWT